MTFISLLSSSALYDGYQRSFIIDDLSVLVIQNQGNVFILENRCPHQDAPLDYGIVCAGRIRCPMHSMEFSLKDGQGVGPAFRTGGIQVFEPCVVDGMLGIYREKII